MIKGNKVLTLIKDKLAYIAVLLLIVLIYAVSQANLNIYNEFTEKIATPDQYHGYNENRLDSLILESDGTMTATNNVNFMVFGDRTILDEPIKTITLNVSEMSCPPVETRLYILDTYERYDFTLHEGKCNITLADAKVLNNGDKPVLIRIDLLDSAGEKVKVDSVVFNDRQACYDAVVNDREADILGAAMTLALILISMYVLDLGIKGNKPDAGRLWLFVALAAVDIVYAFALGSDIILYTLLGFTLVQGLEIIYYVLTKFIFEKIRSFKLLSSVYFSAYLLLLIFLLHFVGIGIFAVFALYLLYLVGYCHRWRVGSTSARAVSLFLCLVFCVLLAGEIHYIGDLHGALFNLQTGSMRAFFASVTALVGAAVIFLRLGLAGINFSQRYICLFPVLSGYCLCILSNTDVRAQWVGVIAAALISGAVLFYKGFENKKAEPSLERVYSDNSVLMLTVRTLLIQICLALLIIIFEVIIKRMLFDMGKAELGEYLLEFIFSPVFFYNLLLLNAVYYLFTFLMGTGLGATVFGVLNIALFVANFVKLRYHDAMFKPGDLFQLKDFFSIVANAVRLSYIPFIILAVLIIGFVLFKLRRYIVTALRPRIKPLCVIVSAVLLFGSCLYIYRGGLIDIGVTYGDKWLSDELRTERQGFYIYTYFNSLSIKDIIMLAPDGYDEKNMEEISDEAEALGEDDVAGETKPDVIVLMMESMFDLENVPGIEFNMELETNIKQYQSGNVISPTFGGGTANVEFEALTGFSSYFVAENVVPYVTYWNSENEDIPSIAHQFKSNGYETIAIHPNNADFYNRDIIYEDMGFDDFISIEDMPADILRNARGYVRNSELTNIMFDRLEKDDTPKFLFTINIENHNPYDIKDTDKQVEAYGDMTDSERNELEVYANTLDNDDQMVADVIEYVNNTDRPTLLYIWGDHLPSLAAVNNSGYINYVYNKYTTPIIAYSNYKNIEIGCEYITPNQIAPQVLRDAGIEYSSYFDYIYSLREDYPVIQKEFGINPEDEAIKTYELIQYDLLFGDEYLLESP